MVNSMKTIFAILLLSIFCGCATHNFSEDLLDGGSVGFLRNHSAERGESQETIVEEFADDGRITRRTTTRKIPAMKVSTQSSTADLLLGMNELLGTAVDGASKVK